MASNHYNVQVITPPVGPVLSLASVKLHLKQDLSADDSLITSLISAVQDDAERYCNRRFRTQQLKLYQDNFYEWYMLHNLTYYPWYQYYQVPYPPCQSIDQIDYIDVNGNPQTLSSSIYLFDIVAEPARVYHAYNTAFPLVRTIPNAVQTTFTCGWADDNSNNPTCPLAIQQGMLMTIEHLYRHRGEVSELKMEQVPMGAQRLYDKYRIMDY